MEEQKEPKFYNIEQLSNILGISRSKAYELVSSPDCPFVALKIGKRVCIPANSFYKWYGSLVQDTNTEKEDILTYANTSDIYITSQVRNI